jgi:hypothetical protein
VIKYQTSGTQAHISEIRKGADHMIFNNSRKEKKSLQEKKTPIEAKLEFL